MSTRKQLKYQKKQFLDDFEPESDSSESRVTGGLSAWVKKRAAEKAHTSSRAKRRGSTHRPPRYIVTPKMKSYQSSQDSKDIIDLSQDPEEYLNHGATFKYIKESHTLFWSYDPRGMGKEFALQNTYCSHCRCPKNYCADVVMGDVTSTHVEFLMNRHTDVHDLTGYNIKKSFGTVYSEQVNHKMQQNGIAFDKGMDFKKKHDVPKCMLEGSLKRLTTKWVDSSSTRLEFTVM